MRMAGFQNPFTPTGMGNRDPIEHDLNHLGRLLPARRTGIIPDRFLGGTRRDGHRGQPIYLFVIIIVKIILVLRFILIEVIAIVVIH